MLFGLGLEGKPNIGHEVLWALLQPGASLEGPLYLLLAFNSLVWGFGGALLVVMFRRLLLLRKV